MKISGWGFNARCELEQKNGRKVVTIENYLALTQVVNEATAMKA